MIPISTVGTYVYVVILVILPYYGISQSAKEIVSNPLLSNLKHGSAGAILLRGDTITIGADSRIHLAGAPLTDEGCKILIFDNIVFAHTGIWDINNLTINEIANTTFHRPLSFEHRLKMFEHDMSAIILAD